MVWRAVSLLLIVALAPATGQLAVLVEDEEGDHRFQTTSGNLRLPMPAGEYDHIDIVDAGIWSEDATSLTFYVRPADLSQESERPVPYGDPVYDVMFQHGLQRYRVHIELFLENQGTALIGDPATFGRLDIEREAGSWHTLADATTSVDVSEGVIVATVPRAMVLDHNQAPLAKGSVLHNIHLTATAMGWFGVPLFTGSEARTEVGPPQAFDEAGPKSMFEPNQYVMQTGLDLHRGQLIAGTSDPVRWTNGEATTFAYTIRLTNTGDKDLIVKVSHSGADQRWQVAFTDRFTVPGNQHINVTFHVAIPFTHGHGRLHEMQVHFESVDGDHRATAIIGVHWPLIPQPAGHHDTIWFHSRDVEPTNPFQLNAPPVHAWMNAADATIDVLDTQTPVPAYVIRPKEAGVMQAEWRILLEPSLRMGLDFELERTGAATIEIDFPAPIQDPTLRFQLRAYDTRFIIPSSTLLVSESITMPGQFSGVQRFEFETLVPRPAADLIPYVSSADLELNLTLEGLFVGAGVENPPEATPTFLPGTSIMQLPLREYHDPLNTIFFTDASATAEVGEEGLEKEVNAGEQVVYNMYLSYQGVFETDFVVELSGHQADWAKVLGAQRFTMQPGDRREVAISVAPPPGTAPQSLDTVIKCISTTNAAVQAGIVVRTLVVAGMDLQDETELAEEKQQVLAPEPPPSRPVWPFVLGGSLVVAGAAAFVLWKRVN